MRTFEAELSALRRKADGRAVRSMGDEGKLSDERVSKRGWNWLRSTLTPIASVMPYPLSPSLCLFS